MQSSSYHWMAIIAFIGIGAKAVAADAPVVVATDLGTLGGSTSQAMAVNTTGMIAGASDTVGDTSYHAFLWTLDLGMIDVGAPSGYWSYAVGVSAAGQVAVTAYVPGVAGADRAFAWTRDGGMVEIGLGGSQAHATAASDTGQVVGWAPTPTSSLNHAFSWTRAGGTVDLTPADGALSIAWGVSSAGHVVGTSARTFGDLAHAFIWTPETGLTQLPDDGRQSVALSVNSAGYAAGYIDRGSSYHAALWTPDRALVDLGTLGGNYAVALAINEAGRVIGYSTLAGNDFFSEHGFSWTAGEGMVDLGTLGGSWSWASGVNATGQVAGVSKTPGDAASHAFLWTRQTGMIDLGAAGTSSAWVSALNDDGLVVGDAWDEDPVQGPSNDHATSWRIAPAGYTAPGSGVSVTPTDPANPGTVPPIDLVFDSVSSNGMTTVTTTVAADPPPAGFKLGNPPVYYDIATSAHYSGNVDVCVKYVDPGPTQERSLELLHFWDPGRCAGKPPGIDPGFDYSQAGWERVTKPGYPDTANDIICGAVTCLSPFAVVQSFEITGPTAPVAVNSTVTLSAPFNREVAAIWDFGDGTIGQGSQSAAGSWTGTHAYRAAGVYTVTVSLRSEADLVVGSTQYRYVVVYDALAGFVTGGGWIESPRGTCGTSASAGGKARFGFIAKYDKGTKVPTGSTEFQFGGGDLNFHSITYDWLVISGAKATYNGTGTINGQGTYRFTLAAIDADASATDAYTVDRFRMRIWFESGGSELVVYDNACGDSGGASWTEIASGAIAIHAK